MFRHEHIINKFRYFCALIFLALLPTAGYALEFELFVTNADVQGKCLHQGQWVDVKGNYHYWQLTEFSKMFPEKQDGSLSGKNIGLHKTSLLRPTNKSNFDRSDGSLTHPIYFDLQSIRPSQQIEELMEKNFPEFRHLKAMKVQLKNQNLLPAIVVAEVPESYLSGLNKLRDPNPFNDNESKLVSVPIGYAVCDVKVTYLMDGAKARYTQSFIGGKTLTKDNTVPLGQGKKSFAAEFISR